MTEIILDDNKIIQNGTKFRFSTPYEITINDSEVKNIIFHQGEFILHIDISATEAQQTLSEFVSNIASICRDNCPGISDLNSDISISNIALKIDFDSVSLAGSKPEYVNSVSKNPYTLKGGIVDIILEWSNFVVKDQNLAVNLLLSTLNVNNLEQKPSAPIYNTIKSYDSGFMSLLKETSTKTLDNKMAPEMFLEYTPFNVSYILE